jgi:hypothetical protein
MMIAIDRTALCPRLVPDHAGVRVSAVAARRPISPSAMWLALAAGATALLLLVVLVFLAGDRAVFPAALCYRALCRLLDRGADRPHGPAVHSADAAPRTTVWSW